MSQTQRSIFDDEEKAPECKPLTAQEVRRLCECSSSVGPWRVLAWQVLAGFVAAVAAWGLTGSASAGWSALYGALVVVLPAALLARGIGRRADAASPGAVVFRFLGWEAVKLTLSVAMLVAAPRVVAGLNWLALLAGMVLAMKTYWLALWVGSGSMTTKD